MKPWKMKNGSVINWDENSSQEKFVGTKMENGSTIIGGMRVFTSEYLTKDGPAEEVKRTLGERLCQFKPWRPFKLTKTIIPQIPSDVIYKVNGKHGLYAGYGVPLSDDWFLVMHPNMLTKIAVAMVKRYDKLSPRDKVLRNFMH